MPAADANFDFDSAGLSTLGGTAAPILCFRLPTADDGAPDPDAEYEPLENLVCEQIQFVEGPTPPQARFRYLLDVIAEEQGYPTRFEAIWPVDATGKGVVKTDDRIVVLTETPDARPIVIFDGFAQVPQVNVSGSTQQITFTAVGVAARCFDEPIARRLQRDADKLAVAGAVRVDLPTRFNPDGKPNCTRDGDAKEESESNPDNKFPVFADERLARAVKPTRIWSLGAVARYLLGAHNDETWVENPNFDDLDDFLQTRTPKEGKVYDPLDPDTYDSKPIVVRDFDATNRPWPEALGELLALHGFGMRWVLTTDDDGRPRNAIDLHRLDSGEAIPPKTVDLDVPGSELDPGKNNVSALALARDVNFVVNEFAVEAALKRIEASFVLAPGFVPVSGDELVGFRQKYLKSAASAASSDDRVKYRLYVLDEAGDGHYDWSDSAWSTTPADLAELFPPDDEGERTHVRRRRPAAADLLTRDAAFKALRPQLHFSRNYDGPVPGVWDGTGDWQPIVGGWRLLEDRLGIEVTTEDPDRWPIGEYRGANPQERSTTLRAVTSQANPSGRNQRFHLRLTAAIDADQAVAAEAPKRPASPTKYPRRRRVDARDVHRVDVVSKRSALNERDADVNQRDDAEAAKTLATQLRASGETPPLVGSIEVPSLTDAYVIGDRIERVRGRDADLRGNAAESQGEPAILPRVVSVVWSFVGDRQSTTVGFTDRPGDPPRV